MISWESAPIRQWDEAGLTDQIKIFSYDGVTEGLAVCDRRENLSPPVPSSLWRWENWGVVNMAKIFAGEEAEAYIDTGCQLADQRERGGSAGDDETGIPLRSAPQINTGERRDEL